MILTPRPTADASLRRVERFQDRRDGVRLDWSHAGGYALDNRTLHLIQGTFWRTYHVQPGMANWNQCDYEQVRQLFARMAYIRKPHADPLHAVEVEARVRKRRKFRYPFLGGV